MRVYGRKQRKQGEQRVSWNGRQKVLGGLVASALFLGLLCLGGLLPDEAVRTADFSRKNLAPCFPYLFGTDWMGRNMFARTLKGISLSIRLGILASAVSGCVALFLGTAAAVGGKTVDRVVSFLIDLLMGIPHILLLILISVAMGKGFRGVVTGVALTHWPSLARLIRAEVIQLRESPYILAAGKLGKSRLYIVKKHMIPHLLPQFLVGVVLLFPHAILHESGITFLGFGLSAEQPAIGIILSESMRYLITGEWWLAVFPGVLLAAVVCLFYHAGDSLRKLTMPGSAHR